MQIHLIIGDSCAPIPKIAWTKNPKNLEIFPYFILIILKFIQASSLRNLGIGVQFIYVLFSLSEIFMIPSYWQMRKLQQIGTQLFPCNFLSNIIFRFLPFFGLETKRSRGSAVSKSLYSKLKLIDAVSLYLTWLRTLLHRHRACILLLFFYNYIF